MSRAEEAEPTDPSLRFYKSRNSRHAVPTMDGRKPIYDFDAWYVPIIDVIINM